MKRYAHALGLALLLLGIAACREDEPVRPPQPRTGTLRMTLIPEWEGRPFEGYTEYRNFMDYRVSVEMLKMYLGDARLVHGTDTLPVKDVDLFDLVDGPMTRDWTAPVGTRTKLRMALGVPRELNHANPANYGADHPLSTNNGGYWTWATGYRYVMLEGRYDTDPGNTGAMVLPFAIHPGRDSSYVEFELAPAGGIAIHEGAVTEIRVRVAVDRFFHSSGHLIDLATENSAHGQNFPLQWKLVNNVVRSMTVE